MNGQMIRISLSFRSLQNRRKNQPCSYWGGENDVVNTCEALRWQTLQKGHRKAGSCLLHSVQQSRFQTQTEKRQANEEYGKPPHSATTNHSGCWLCQSTKENKSGGIKTAQEQAQWSLSLQPGHGDNATTKYGPAYQANIRSASWLLVFHSPFWTHALWQLTQAVPKRHSLFNIQCT